MNNRGFTLIELMIAIAILAIVSAIAIPAYNFYVRESRLGAMRMNLDSLRIAVEAFKLDSPSSTYKHATIATPSYICAAGGVCSNTTTIAAYGWSPETSQKQAYSYVVSNPTSTVYNLVAEVDTSGWVRCEKNPAINPPFKCCATGDSGATKTACP